MKGFFRNLALAAAAAVLLAGCAHPDRMAYGTTETDVVAELGAPHARTPLKNGDVRLVYSHQPMAQAVWWLTFDAEGRLKERRNVLDREHFALIRPGVSTKEDVFALFGPCAEKYTFHLKNERAWMYRFLDGGFFHMACWVQFDMRGIVTEVGYTTDPWHDRDAFWP